MIDTIKQEPFKDGSINFLVLLRPDYATIEEVSAGGISSNDKASGP